MKWTTTTALILAASTVAMCVNGVLTPKRANPRALLEELASPQHAGSMGQREALRRLTMAIDALDVDEEPDLSIALYRARAGVYRSLGLLGSAREDLEFILGNWASGDLELELEVSGLMALEGQTEAALARARRLADSLELSDADEQRASLLLGRLETSLAEQRRSLAIELSVKSLDEKGGRRATEIITEASARGAGDPRTSELYSELRGIFRDHESAPISDVLDLVSEAGKASRAAIQAFGRSMQLSPTPLAVTEVSQVLASVGYEDHAAELMLSARAVPAIERSAVAVGTTLRLLERTGRMARARSIGGTWDSSWGGDLDFYREATALLYHAGQQSAVSNMARGMRELGGALAAYWTSFYFSASAIRGVELAVEVNPTFEVPTKGVVDGIAALTKFARNRLEQEPYPGARTDVWFVIAAGARLIGNSDDERSALVTGLSERPSSGADHWIRLAEIESQAAVPAWEQVEARYTVALDQEPARTS
jgi:hypothetical protein